MRRHRRKHRTLAILLSVLMLVNMMSVSALGLDHAYGNVQLGSSSDEDQEQTDRLTGTDQLSPDAEEPLSVFDEESPKPDSVDAVSGPAIGKAPIRTGRVTAFEELPEELRWQNTPVPEFPETVSGCLEGEWTLIPVTWEADHAYDITQPQGGLYVFTAFLSEGYSLADDAELPRITVYIPRTAGLKMSRMAVSGATEQPLEITTAAQLAEIATLVNARRNGLELFLLNNTEARVSLKLANDIDLSIYSKGEGWVPIGTSEAPFTGSFNGDGHRILNLTIDRSDMDDQGLFGYMGTGSLIENLGMENAAIEGRSFVGSLAGKVVGGTVQNCYATGGITGHTDVGGLAGGVHSNGSIYNCYTSVSITGLPQGQVGSMMIGGLAGSIYSSTVQNCYVTGSVVGHEGAEGSIYTGGMVGCLYGNGTIQNCVALNRTVSGLYSVGRIIGSWSTEFPVGNSMLSDNIAYAGMTVREEGRSKTLAEGTDRADGLSATAADIKATGFFEALFGDSALTYESGKMPGFGAALDLPVYIADSIDPFFRGGGTSDNPYLIETPAQLAKLAELVNKHSAPYANPGIYYKLQNNLDLSSYGSNYDDGKGWIPIGNFRYNFEGIFDGNGYQIEGLYIRRTHVDDFGVGLFGHVGVGGMIQNLGVTSVDIIAYRIVGGVVGLITDGTIHNCYSTGTVSAIGDFIGGVVGQMRNGTIQNCYSTASFSGYDQSIVGGVVGSLFNSIAQYCYSTGSVTFTSRSVILGGVVGSCNTSSIVNCAALNPNIEGYSVLGRVVGTSTGTLSGNIAFERMEVRDFYTGKVFDIGANKIDGRSESLARITSAGFFETLFEHSQAWLYTKGKLPILRGLVGQSDSLPSHLSGSSNSGYFQGAGTSDDPYRIYTYVDLSHLAMLVNEGSSPFAEVGVYYKLVNDLDLSAYGKEYNDGKGWIPIGTASHPFQGILDGSKKTIEGLYINRSEQSDIGLFGRISNGSVMNLALKDVEIIGKDRVGAIAGSMQSELQPGTIQSCFISGSISGTEKVGGLVGELKASIVQNSYTDINLTVTGDCAGGLVGFSDSSTVQYCYTTASVTGTGDYTGGLVGSMTLGSLKNSVSISPQIRGAGNVGRVAGFTASALRNNYAFSRIPGRWENKGSDVKDGADLASSVLFDDSFWRTASNWEEEPWDSSVWNFADNKLPLLKGMEGQNGRVGLYLATRDIRYARAIPSTSSYIYIGSLKLPTLTVTFDGELLTEDIDYTYSITRTSVTGGSSDANTLTVTLTLTGIGNYHGTNPVTVQGEWTTDGNEDSGLGSGRPANTDDIDSNTSGIPAADTSDNEPVQTVMPETPIMATTTEDGSAGAVIPDQVITDAIAKAQEDAKAQGITAGDISVTLKFAMPEDSTALTTTLSHNALNSLVNAGVHSLQLKGAPVSLGLDLNALEEIEAQTDGEISISITPATELSDEASALLGDRPVYSITISYVKDGKAVNVSSLGNGTATLSIPYLPGNQETVGYLIGVYVDAAGKVHTISDSVYDSNRNRLLIPTDHFSVYGVGYKAPGTKLADIGNHWAKEAIAYAVGRGLLPGISKTTFAPDSAITREMLVTALGKLAGVDVKDYSMNSFTDVDADSPYRPYIEWAFHNGIMKGIDKEHFAPYLTISREKLAVILMNYFELTGYRLPVSREATAYADASDINRLYKTAVTALQEAGIMMSRADNTFHPTASVTRAEFSSMLHRLVKLTIDPSTAQGWALNDAGQWLYYQNGKALTGTQTIDGVKYCFEATGVLITDWAEDADSLS